MKIRHGLAPDVEAITRRAAVGLLPVIGSVAVALVVGMILAFADPTRFRGAAWGPAFTVLPRPGWAALFVLAAALIAAACMASRRLVFLSLYVAGALWAWWGVMFTIAVFADHASGTAAVLQLYAAYCQLVTAERYRT